MSRKTVIPVLLVASVTAGATALAGYEAPNSAYNPPASYYNGATSSVGATLKTQLNTIINNGFTGRSYDSITDEFATSPYAAEARRELEALRPNAS